MIQKAPIKVQVTGGMFWMGLMLFIIAMNTCEMKEDIEKIQKEIPCAASSDIIR